MHGNPLSCVLPKCALYGMELNLNLKKDIKGNKQKTKNQPEEPTSPKASGAGHMAGSHTAGPDPQTSPIRPPVYLAAFPFSGWAN